MGGLAIVPFGRDVPTNNPALVRRQGSLHVGPVVPGGTSIVSGFAPRDGMRSNRATTRQIGPIPGLDNAFGKGMIGLLVQTRLLVPLRRDTRGL